MEKSIGFRVTIEFDYPEAMDEKTFHDEFNCNVMAAFNSIQDRFSNVIDALDKKEHPVSVELIPAPKLTVGYRPIGQIFNYNRTSLEVVKVAPINFCVGCYFDNTDCMKEDIRSVRGECSEIIRSGDEEVIFREVKNQ